MKPGKRICQLTYPHSYRGYYRDLAFQSNLYLNTSVKEALNLTKGCVGATFEGWKGGEYKMTKDTLIWIADPGCSGHQLLDIDEDGGLILKQELI